MTPNRLITTSLFMIGVLSGVGAHEPQLHRLTSATGAGIDAAVIGVDHEKLTVTVLINNEIPIAKFSEASQKTIELLTDPDSATREWANTPDFIRVPKSIDMTLEKYLQQPVAERITMVGTMLYICITEGVATKEFVRKVSEPQQLNLATVQYEAFSTLVFKALPPDTKFAVALGAFLRARDVLSEGVTSAD